MTFQKQRPWVQGNNVRMKKQVVDQGKQNRNAWADPNVRFPWSVVQPDLHNGSRGTTDGY